MAAALTGPGAEEGMAQTLDWAVPALNYMAVTATKQAAENGSLESAALALKVAAVLLHVLRCEPQLRTDLLAAMTKATVS